MIPFVMIETRPASCYILLGFPTGAHCKYYSLCPSLHGSKIIASLGIIKIKSLINIQFIFLIPLAP